MSTSGRRGSTFPLIGDLANSFPGGPKALARTLALIAIVIAVIVLFGAFRGKRYAAWAPLDVVESTDPLQELPVRVANASGAVAPAESHDATLDVSRISSLVVGVDLDFVPRGAKSYVAVLEDASGTERFRDVIDPKYFDDGRFMLRLFSKRMPAGEYLLEVEATENDGTAHVVAASWFEIVK